jgi:NAD(P)-dependent dehydrogenase (short-subunit alcohol dehydrogenase family)
MDISGLAAIVTGGASGLGAATAELLAARGAKVTLFDLNAEVGQAKARDRRAFAKVDVTDASSVEQAIAQAEAAHGKARILVNCAGIAPPAKVISREGAPAAGQLCQDHQHQSDRHLQRAFAVRGADFRCRSPERGWRARHHRQHRQRRGLRWPDRPARLCRQQGRRGGHGLPIAREFARYGIRVNTIAPGIFWTPMLAGLPQEAQDSLGKQTPFPSRLGHPSEYAKMVEAMIANPMLNGEVVRLDGAIRLAAK